MTYHFLLVGSNSVGMTYGSDQTFVTLPPGSTGTGAAPIVATGIAILITSNSATLTGTVNPNGLTTLAQFEWGTDTNYDSTTPLQSAGAGANGVRIATRLTGLSPNTTYHFRLVAGNNAGTTNGMDMVFNTISSNNLLQNPGFEAGLAGWSVSEGTATYVLDSSQPHSGLLCAKGTEIDAGSLGRLYQDVTAILTPGHQYIISGWIKSQNVTGGGAVVAVDYVGSTGWIPVPDGYVKEVGYVVGTTGWTFYQSSPFILPPMPADATALWFLMDFNNGTGTAWFDDLTLEEVSSTSNMVVAISGGGDRTLVLRI